MRDASENPPETAIPKSPARKLAEQLVDGTFIDAATRPEVKLLSRKETSVNIEEPLFGSYNIAIGDDATRERAVDAVAKVLRKILPLLRQKETPSTDDQMATDAAYTIHRAVGKFVVANDEFLEVGATADQVISHLDKLTQKEVVGLLPENVTGGFIYQGVTAENARKGVRARHTDARLKVAAHKVGLDDSGLGGGGQRS